MTSTTADREKSLFNRDEMLLQVHNERSRVLFREALDSFNAGAHRASVVMMSCAVFEDLRLKAANQAHFDKTAEYLSEELEGKRKEQRSYEQDVLKLTDKYDPLDSDHKRYLKQLLESRNQAAHGSGAHIDEGEARRMIQTGFDLFLSIKFPWGNHGIEELIARMSDVDMYPAALPYDHEHTTRHEIELRDPRIHWKMFNKIGEQLGTASPRFHRNAAIFLYWTASFQECQFQKYLSLALLENRSLPSDSAWLIDVLGADPAILNQHSKKSEGAVDASIAAIIHQLPSEEEDRILALETVFQWLLTAADGEAPRLRLTMEAALKKLLVGPSFHAGLSTKHKHRALAQRVLISSTFDHDTAEELVAAMYERWEEGHETFFSRMLDGDVAFSLVMNLSRAGLEGKPRCSGLSATGFGPLPGIRKKAIDFLGSDPDRADMMLEDYEWYGYSHNDFFEQFLKLSPQDQARDWGQEVDQIHDDDGRPNRPFGFRKKTVSASEPKESRHIQTDPAEKPSLDAVDPSGSATAKVAPSQSAAEKLVR
ncbi:hypothetical protein [Ensifer adhaerens]|uniref:hypothetical protein n=1 Tax=Ensifer adhaerens TaxID=106592 RepID=UPI00098F22B1|nr:hypothetical protein [Ensifer adhaerens]